MSRPCFDIAVANPGIYSDCFLLYDWLIFSDSFLVLAMLCIFLALGFRLLLDTLCRLIGLVWLG